MSSIDESKKIYQTKRTDQHLIYWDSRGITTFQIYEIKFKHPMINDYNLHCICPNDYDPSLDLFWNGKKPMASYVSMIFVLAEMIKTIDSEKYDFDVIQCSNVKHYGILFVAPKKTIIEVFPNLDTLIEDYKTYGLDAKELELAKNKKFKEFFSEDLIQGKCGLLLTGLLFGYPIESTISLLLNHNSS